MSEAAPQAAAETAGRPGSREARLRALKAVYPELQLDRKRNDGIAGMTWGRLSPGHPWTRWARWA
jgi:hypothetical protein